MLKLVFLATLCTFVLASSAPAEDSAHVRNVRQSGQSPMSSVMQAPIDAMNQAKQMAERAVGMATGMAKEVMNTAAGSMPQMPATQG